MSIFASRSPAPKTKETAKISRLAQKVSKAARERTKSGPCVTVYKKPE